MLITCHQKNAMFWRRYIVPNLTRPTSWRRSVGPRARVVAHLTGAAGPESTGTGTGYSVLEDRSQPVPLARDTGCVGVLCWEQQ